MGGRLELTGKIFGLLKVIRDAGNSPQGKAIWECEDSSGFVKKIRTAELLAGKRVNKNLPTKIEDKKVLRRYTSYKHDAKKDNRSFNLDYKKFKELVLSDCHYCGESPGKTVKSAKNKKPTETNGLDRVDSGVGYIIGNVVPCRITCNRGKSNMSLQAWKEYIARLIAFNDKKAGI